MVAELLGCQATAPRSQGSCPHRRRCIHHVPAVRSAGSLESAGRGPSWDGPRRIRIGTSDCLLPCSEADAGDHGRRRLAAVQALAEHIRRELSRSNLGAIEESIFGTADPDEMVAILDRYCRLHLGAGPAGGLFYLGSAGCAAGIRLESGDELRSRPTRSVGRRPTSPRSNRCRRTSRHEGFPCPRPLVPPRPLQPGRPHLAMVESFLADPGMEPLRGSEACRHSAAGLARQVVLCRARRRSARWPNILCVRAPGRLYRSPTVPSSISTGPRPGRPGSTTTRREHLVAREADHSAPVVAHMDWSARNIRIGPRGLVGRLRLGQPRSGAREHRGRAGRGDMVRHQRTRRFRVSFARKHHRVRASVRRGMPGAGSTRCSGRHGCGRGVRAGLHRSL